MKNVFESMDDFLDYIGAYKIVSSRESDIFYSEDDVYKIFYGRTTNKELNNKHNIKKIMHLDTNLITSIEQLVYISDKYAGFVMKNSGHTLTEQCKNEELNKNIKKDICFMLKDISLYLKRKRFVHLDITLDNLLYDKTTLRLADVNNLICCPSLHQKLFNSVHIPELYKKWRITYKNPYLIDQLAINYCTYLLLNLSNNEIKKYYNHNSPYFTKTACKILKSENKYFDQEILDQLRKAFLGSNKDINEKKLKNIYLIDYLK